MKFKKISKDYFITILDRLTRVVPACERYKRVFDDVINKFCISSVSKNISLTDNIKIATDIINYSTDENNNNDDIYTLLQNLEEKYFVKNDISKLYIRAKIDYRAILNSININSSVLKNVLWLYEISNNSSNIVKLRKEKSLLYPVEKIILCEGQTEYALLKTIFKLFDYDFDKEGCLVVPAGGKNQVARKYYYMREIYNIPIYILLDRDALQIKQIIDKKLRNKDKIYLIKSGEFEDLIPNIILADAINYAHKNEYNCMLNDFINTQTSVLNLENIYKKYGFGEFKKAKFASVLDEYINKNCTKNDFENSELNEIINVFSN